jgi:hypothetical protein
MSDKITKIVAVIALVFGLVAMIGVSGIANNPSVGGMYNTNVSHNYAGIYAGSGDEFSVTGAGVVTTSGNIAGATQSLSGILTLNKAVGCVNFYATSTATRTNMSFIASSTAYSIGYMIAKYGACS